MKLIRSFYYAWQGLRYCIKTQLNFRIHLCCLLLVIIVGFAFSISHTEWLVIALCSMLVICLEAINTAIENLCNLVKTEINPTIKIIKDVMAGAVLIAAIGSVVVAAIIFIPKIIALLQ